MGDSAREPSNSSMPDIRALAKNAPDELVSKLAASDMAFWEAVKAQVLRPFFEGNAVYRRRMADANVELDDIYREVYMRMVPEGKLAALRKREFVCEDILEYAKAYVRAFFDHPDYSRPASRTGRPRKPQIQYRDPRPADGSPGLENIPEEPTAETDDGDLDEKTLSTYEALRDGFDTLWSRNPRRAVAVLLRYVKGLSAHEVKTFMDLVSENYVNQVVNIAKGDLRKSVISVEETLGRATGKGAASRKPDASAPEAGYSGPAFLLDFVACLPKGHRDWWCASAQVDDFAGNDEVALENDREIQVFVSDGERNPLDGELVIDGLALPVARGRASCSFRLLRLASLAIKPIAFRSALSDLVEGKLVLR